MTRTVTEQAIQLLTKSVSDISGEKRRVADALVAALRSEVKVLAPPVHFGFQEIEPMTRQKIHGQVATMAMKP